MTCVESQMPQWLGALFRDPTPRKSALSLRMSTDKSTAPPATRHDGWTVQRQATFLRELAASHSVKKAAEAAGMSRQSAYGLRAGCRMGAGAWGFGPSRFWRSLHPRGGAGCLSCPPICPPFTRRKIVRPTSVIPAQAGIQLALALPRSGSPPARG